jgi:hypothetical protein
MHPICLLLYVQTRANAPNTDPKPRYNTCVVHDECMVIGMVDGEGCDSFPELVIRKLPGSWGCRHER